MYLDKVSRMRELQNILEKYWYTDEGLDKDTIMAEVEACLNDMAKRQECFRLNLTTLKEDIAEYIFNEYFVDYLPLMTPYQDLKNSKNFIRDELKDSSLYKEATRLLREAILETAKKEGIFKDHSSKEEEFPF